MLMPGPRPRTVALAAVCCLIGGPEGARSAPTWPLVFGAPDAQNPLGTGLECWRRYFPYDAFCFNQTWTVQQDFTFVDRYGLGGHGAWAPDAGALGGLSLAYDTVFWPYEYQALRVGPTCIGGPGQSRIIAHSDLGGQNWGDYWEACL